MESAAAFLRFTALFYAAMGAAGVGLAWATGRLAWFAPPARPLEAYALALLVAASATAFSFALLRRRSGLRLVAFFLAALPPLPRAGVALAALASGFGEEALFRGALLPLLGFWLSTLLFAAAHFPARPALRLWTLFALAVGAALAGLTLRSGSCLPACVAHALVNAAGFALLGCLQRRRGRKRA